uniref:DUF38 domain-containing protein n=1 Tax=Panagrolaimus davidi TaxID=227884 RepID=A0A914Q2I7_9BILA
MLIPKPAKFENLKNVRLGNVKIRSALLSKIIIDANECINEWELKRFIEEYPGFNDICKIHLQYPHDLLFPAEIECASEEIETIKLDCGFLYNFGFMLTTNVLDEVPTDHGKLDFGASMAEMYGFSEDTSYPHTNWYHDQGYLRFIYSKDITVNGVKYEDTRLKLEFDYSSFQKIYIYQFDGQMQHHV